MSLRKTEMLNAAVFGVNQYLTSMRGQLMCGSNASIVQITNDSFVVTVYGIGGDETRPLSTPSTDVVNILFAASGE